MLFGSWATCCWSLPLLITYTYLPPMYDPGAGEQTLLKIALEYLIIIMLALPVLKLWRKSPMDRQDYYFCMALITGIFSELAFTLYNNAYDTYNLLGHILKIISYAFIFKVMLDDAVGMLYENKHDPGKTEGDAGSNQSPVAGKGPPEGRVFGQCRP